MEYLKFKCQQPNVEQNHNDKFKFINIKNLKYWDPADINARPIKLNNDKHISSFFHNNLIFNFIVIYRLKCIICQIIINLYFFYYKT